MFRLFLGTIVPAAIVSVALCHAQVIELSGGASTSYGAQGAGIHVHGERTDSTLGIGVVQGSFAAGGATSRAVSGGVLTLGQQELHMDLPTDVFDTAHFLFATGLGFRRVEHGSSIQAFVGYASQEAGTPLFRAANIGRPTQYFQWVHPVSRACSIVATELLGPSSAAIVSSSCSVSRGLTLAISAGKGGGSPYGAASIAFKRSRFRLRGSYSYASDRFRRGNNPFQPTPEPIRANITFERQLSRHFNISASHGSFLTPATLIGTTDSSLTAPIRSSLDYAALQFQQRSFGAGVSVIHSQYGSSEVPLLDGSVLPRGSNTAISSTFRYTRPRWQFNQVLLHSFSDQVQSTRSTILSNTIAVNLWPRLRLSEGVTFSGGQTTFSHGVTLLTRYSSIALDYQFFYVANLPDQPFQQALPLNAELQLPLRFSLHANSTLDAIGRPLYTIQVRRTLVRDRAPGALLETSFGDYLIHGRVEDDHGRPIEGAVLKIGDARLYTTSDGYFQYRERKPATHQLEVLPSEFIDVGEYVTLSAPTTVRSYRIAQSTPVRIIVTRPPQTNALNATSR